MKIGVFLEQHATAYRVMPLSCDDRIMRTKEIDDKMVLCDELFAMAALFSGCYSGCQFIFDASFSNSSAM